MNNTIKVQRVLKNTSQKELSEYLGVTRQTMHAIENKRFVPSTVLALKIARFFDMKVEELFELEEND